MDKIIGLKQLRENIDLYVSAVQKDGALIVVRRSRPLFKMAPLDEEEQWQEVADFTKIRKGGVNIKDILSRL